MSKRVPYPRHIVSAALALSAVALLFFTVTAENCLAARPLISIERTHNTFQGTSEYVDVRFDPNGTDFQSVGFELLIGYDSLALKLESVQQGSLLTNCGWEIFTYRVGANADCSGNCPTGVVRIFALAHSVPEPGTQLCNLGESGAGTIAVLKFLVTNDPAYECAVTPVEFFWASCSDNGFSSVTGTTHFLADSVFSLDPSVGSFPTPAGLNTNQGIPELCLVGGGSNQPQRAVNFRHGSVDIVCTDTVDYRGDLNLNGIAYEVADASLFANYYLHGLAAFSPDPAMRQAQIEASDANANNMPLEFRDLIYELRVISGDALPFPKAAAPADTLAAVFTQNTESKFVSVQYPAPLAGAYLVFVGEITPTFLPAAPGNFIQSSAFENGLTRVLLAGTEPSATPGTIWFNYTGNGILQSVETTDFDDSPIDVEILIESSSFACGDVNHDSHINISDIVAMIGAIFDLWPSPVDPALADVDCSGTMTISDVVYLLQYIFASGNAPCANCP